MTVRTRPAQSGRTYKHPTKLVTAISTADHRRARQISLKQSVILFQYYNVLLTGVSNSWHKLENIGNIGNNLSLA